MVGLRIAMFVGARFCFSGAYNKHFRRIPCILDFVMKPKDMDDTKKQVLRKFVVHAVAQHVFYWAASLFHSIVADGLVPWRVPRFIHGMEAAGHGCGSTPLVFVRNGLLDIEFSLPVLGESKEGFFIMLAHHLATSLLLAGSFLWNYWRIGLCVLLLHDVSDVFLYATKSGKDHLPRAVTEGLFVCLAISYFVLRMMIYPGVCVYTAIRTGYAPFVDPILATLFGAEPFPTDPEMIAAGVGCYSAPILLSVLFVLHCIWFTMIIQVAKRR